MCFVVHSCISHPVTYMVKTIQLIDNVSHLLNQMVTVDEAEVDAYVQPSQFCMQQ